MTSHDRRTEASPDHPGDGALEQLLETERALAGELARAAEESERIAAEAAREAVQLEQAFDEALARELDERRAGAARERDAATDAAREQARRDAARFEAIPDDEIDALADRVLARLFQLGPAISAAGGHA